MKIRREDKWAIEWEYKAFRVDLISMWRGKADKQIVSLRSEYSMRIGNKNRVIMIKWLINNVW